MRRQIIVKGHTLPFEGQLRSPLGHTNNGPGHGACSCGAKSPEPLPSTAARQRWHREHKLEILARDAGMDSPMEAGRFLIRLGRHWLPLTDEDVERGARAVVNDPIYRTEIRNDALRAVMYRAVEASVEHVELAFDFLGGEPR